MKPEAFVLLVLLGTSLIGPISAYISPVAADQTLTPEFLENEVIVTAARPPGCNSYPVNFSHADITNNNLGGIEGFPSETGEFTPAGEGPCYDAINDTYSPCASNTSFTMKLEGVAEDLNGGRIDCVISIDQSDPARDAYTTPVGNNGRQRLGSLFSIGLLSYNTQAPLLFSFYDAAGNPVFLPEINFAVLDTDQDGPDGDVDFSLWPNRNNESENWVDEVSLREYFQVWAVQGTLYAYYTKRSTQAKVVKDSPTVGAITVNSRVFGAGAPIVLPDGANGTVTYSCPSNWFNAAPSEQKDAFLNRITPTNSTCDDGNPLDPTTTPWGSVVTEQQEDRAVIMRFFNTHSFKVNLFTIGKKSNRPVSRNYLFTGINQPFPCPPPPSSPPAAPPPPFCDVCTERDPECSDECVECLDYAVNKAENCTENCTSCLEDAYANSVDPSTCGTGVGAGCAGIDDYADKCGPVEGCSTTCASAGIDYAEQCGSFVICEFCERKLATRPYCLKDCQECFPYKLNCTECADPSYPLYDDVRCGTDGPYACVNEYPAKCSEARSLCSPSLLIHLLKLGTVSIHVPFACCSCSPDV
eukprot:2309323-Pleurochrysis_carterae.AAC.2